MVNQSSSSGAGSWGDPQEADAGAPGGADGGSGVTVRPAEFTALGASAPQGAPGRNLGLLMGVGLEIAVELGRATMSIKDVLNLALGSIVELDKLAGEPVNILVNGVLLAHGEVVVVDEQFGVRITEIIPAERRPGLVS